MEVVQRGGRRGAKHLVKTVRMENTARRGRGEGLVKEGQTGGIKGTKEVSSEGLGEIKAKGLSGPMTR